MGACLTLDAEERKAKAKSDQVDKYLNQCARQDSNVVKILLLVKLKALLYTGAGESGKSTLVKQMKIIHNDGFTPYELQSFKATILENLVSSMRFVLNGMGRLRINLERPQHRIHAQTLLACQQCCDRNLVMFAHISEALHALWTDRGVRLAVARGFEYELNDSAAYYFENMSRICSPRFVPNSTDVLRARVRTTGIIETCFKIQDLIFRMFDVGGQRSERKKWIQCFDDVRAILFVVALSGYDMTLYEDPNTNRIDESLRMFASICNNRFFHDTSMILFLNKVDLFQEKIITHNRHLRYYFRGYMGADRDVESAALYIQSLFTSSKRLASKVIYPHFTTATDTSNIQVVFEVVMDTIIKENLKTASLL